MHCSSGLACRHRAHSQVVSLPGLGFLRAPSLLAQASHLAARPSNRTQPSIIVSADAGAMSHVNMSSSRGCGQHIAQQMQSCREQERQYLTASPGYLQARSSQVWSLYGARGL